MKKQDSIDTKGSVLGKNKKRGTYVGDAAFLPNHTVKVSFDGNGGGIISPSQRHGGSN